MKIGTFLFFVVMFFPLSSVLSQPVEGTGAISTDNYANRQLSYYYYIPVSIVENKSQQYPLLICVPGLSGRGEAFVSPVFKQFADKEGFVIISPSFVWDEANWESRQSYQFPEVWSGQALLNIIDDFSQKQGVNTGKLYLIGISAGAQFVLRFALWNPVLCSAVAAHASGGMIIPQNKSDVKFFVTVGSRDDAARNNNARIFYETARNLGIDVVYQQYDCGHELTLGQIEDSLGFFRK